MSVAGPLSALAELPQRGEEVKGGIVVLSAARVDFCGLACAFPHNKRRMQMPGIK